MSALTGPVQPPQTQIIPVVEAPRTVRRDLLRGRTESWWDRMVLAGVGVLATVLGLWNLTGATAYQDDEGTYTAQAFSVLEGQLAPYTYWYDHPPLGWIQLGSLAWLPELLGLGDGTYIGATRFAIVPFFVATAMLVYLIGRRLGVSRPIAGLTVLVFVLSPLTLVIGRQVYIDNIGIPWLLLAFYLALSPRGALWHHVGAGVFFAVAVLSKETLAIFGPALLVALLNRPNWSNRVFSTVGFLVVGGLVLFSYPLMALLRGELFAGPNHVSLQEALAFQFMDRSVSGSIWEAGSSRAELLEGWLYYDTYLVLAGVAAGVLCLMRRRAVWIPVAMATFAVPVLTGEGYLPSMYIIGVVPFLALALGVAADILWSAFRKVVAPLAPRPRTVATIVVGAAAILGAASVTVPHWWGQSRALLTEEENTDWASTLAWVQENVPRQDTILVPYSMWQDVNTSGWDDPWDAVVTEKVDLDSQFLREHPEGAEALDWIIVGPFTQANIDSLGLDMVEEALEESEPVQTFGGWSVHEVISP